MRGLFSRWMIALMALLCAASVFADGLAVDFGADYVSANKNATKILSSKATVDADFDGSADDRAGSIPFGTVFSPAGAAGWTTPTNKSGAVIKFGVSVANIDSAVDPANLALSRISSSDIMQEGNGASSSTMRMATAWYWEKSSFVNSNDTATGLSFSNATDSLSAYFNNGGTPATGFSRRGHFLVKNGSDWYISVDEFGGTSGSKEINAATADWYVFDPAAGTLFWNRNDMGASVAGSTFTDIQALGLYVQHELIDGSANNAAIHAFSSLKATVVETGIAPPTSVAVDFGGDYRDGNQNAAKALVLETGDYDFDGTADDRRGSISIDTAFLTPIIIEAGKEAGVAGKNKNLYAGYQIANFNSATDPAQSPNYKYSGSGDAAMATSAAGTTDMGMAFAPYVKKDNFLNGFNDSSTNLVFENIAGSVSFSIRQFDEGQTARALVKNGSNWYISSNEVTSAATLSVNGYAETWYSYDPADNLFMNTASLGAGVSGSELLDIQAVGVLVQGLSFDGTGANAANLQIEELTANMVKTNAPATPTTEYTVTDDFNRADTAWSSVGSDIRSDWNLSGANLWRISGNQLEADTPTNYTAAEVVLYNDALETDSGDGTEFEFSADVMATTNEQWCGVVFNYQNPSNYYEMRIKSGATSYQVIPRIDGAVAADRILKADALVTWEVGTAYTFTVTSSEAYSFGFTITEAGSSTVLNPTTAATFTSQHKGGYAGFFAPKTNMDIEQVPDVIFDNFSLIVSVPEGSQTYENWIDQYNVGTKTAMTDDYDGDGMDHLTEYALGGNPEIDDAGSVLPLSAVDSANGRFVYVYDRRTDASARGLAYTLKTDISLTANTWTTNGVSEVGSGASFTGFESVTNTVPTDFDARFLRLLVELTE